MGLTTLDSPSFSLLSIPVSETELSTLRFKCTICTKPCSAKLKELFSPLATKRQEEGPLLTECV